MDPRYPSGMNPSDEFPPNVEYRGGPPVQRTPTRRENVGPPPATPKGQAAAKPDEDDSTPHRPVNRPPMALLCAVDDGSEQGEWFRIRGDRTVIGRSQGDVV